MAEEIGDHTSGGGPGKAMPTAETAPTPGTKAALEKAKKRREEEGRKPEIRRKRARK